MAFVIVKTYTHLFAIKFRNGSVSHVYVSVEASQITSSHYFNGLLEAYSKENIGSIHLSHYVIFFRVCVSEMVVLSYSVIYYIYIPGTLGPCFHYWCSVYGICKWSDTFWPVGRVRLFADYTISLSSLCRLIWRHWTTKMLVMYMLPSVCLRLRQFSQSSFIRYMGLCVFSLPNSPVMMVRMCTLSYHHHQIGTMNH